MTGQSRSGGAEIIALPTAAPMSSVQGSLALDLTWRTAPPRSHLRSAQMFDLVTAETDSRKRLDALVGRYFQAAVEVATGDRPVGQLLRHTVPEVYRELSERSRTVRAAAGSPAQGPRGSTPARPIVVGVRTALIRDDALEASAHVRYGRRSRAVAARFEIVRDRWQCVTIVWG